MRNLKRVGFFREFGEEDDAPGIRPSVRDHPHVEETRIVRYLETGIPVLATGHVVGDVLDPSVHSVCPPHLLTDGAWLWRFDLPYYVKTYHLELPREFTEHMAANQWTVPAVSPPRVRFPPPS